MNIWQLHRLDAMLMLAMSIPLAFCVFCQVYQCRLIVAAVASRKTLWGAPVFVPADADSADSNVTAALESITRDAAPRLLIIIPAHNEELLLGSTIESITNACYPSARMAILVIADNCTDATAEIAAEHHAFVVVRTDPVHAGKGYALHDVIDWLLHAGECNSISLDPNMFGFEFDAAVFLDADTVVHQDILNAFAARLRAGDEAMQACYGVRNASESVRTRLMTCALALAHLAKPAGRERLGLSDGLKGNGFCLSRRVLQTVPWSGDSVTEDIDYTLRLCEAGFKIRFVPEALVWAQMPVERAAATTQRTRWESGRYHLLRSRVLPLLAKAIRRKDLRLLDRVIELIIPPFAELATIQIVLFAASMFVLLHTGWRAALLLSALSLGLLAVQGSCVLTAMWLARIPGRIAASLLYAPFYVVWKLMVMVGLLVTKPARTWRRTERRRA